MSARERLPGLQHGQIYTYPSKRWRKKRRQYLMHYFHPKRIIRGDVEDGVECIETSGAPGANDDSKDSIPLKGNNEFQLRISSMLPTYLIASFFYETF